MHVSLEKFLKSFLTFGVIYFIFDGLLHFLGIKLASVNNWPESAKAYANLINVLYGSFIFLAAGIIFVIQQDLQKYKNIIFLSAIWSLFHGVALLYLVWSNDYQNIFKNHDSLLVWLPFYREYLTLNSALLFIYSISVYFWMNSLKLRQEK